MKKHKKKIFSLIILLIFIQQCTNVNLIPSIVFNKEEYQSLNNISDSKEFDLKRISNSGQFSITYDTINNSFSVYSPGEMIKIDSLGNEKDRYRISYEQFSRKKEHSVFLKDIRQNKFSDYNAILNTNIKKFYPEKKIKYRDDEIHKISFIKKKIAGEIVFTPIPIEIEGVSYYEIRKNSAVLKIKIKELKYVFQLFTTQSSIDYYTIPEKFSQKTDVSFIIEHQIPYLTGDERQLGVYITTKK